MVETGGRFGSAVIESSQSGAVCGAGFISCGWVRCCDGSCIVVSSAVIGAEAAVVGSYSKTSWF